MANPDGYGFEVFYQFGFVAICEQEMRGFVQGKEMKRTLILVGAFAFATSSVSAGDMFGADWKPKPSVTLFGQKITWALPSLCIGAKAGVLPDAGISPDGLNFKIPYLSLDFPFPSFTVKAGGKTAELKLGAVSKSEHKPE